MAKILDTFYKKLKLIESYPSEARFRCPVCKGTISASLTHKGAWMCVTSGCSVAKVRKKLGLSISYDQERKSRGSPYPELKRMHEIEYSSCDSIIGVDYKDYVTHRPFWVVEDNDSVITYYRLGRYIKTREAKFNGLEEDIKKHDHIKRVDYWDYEKNKWKKRIKPSTNSEILPFFNQEFVGDKRGAVVFLEGEKSAFYFTISTGLLGLSFPASKSTDEKMCRYWFPKFRKNFEGILYFPDNDETGEKKAKNLKKLASEYQIPLKILEPYKKWDGFEEGDDVVEYLTHLGIDDLFNFIMENV
jgi:hypothetical protein